MPTSASTRLFAFARRSAARTAICTALLAVNAALAPVAEAANDGNVTPPAGLQLVKSVQAGGELVYVCHQDAASGYGWSLVGSDATLYNADGTQFGTDAAGPRWLSRDGSSLIADSKKPVQSVTRDGSVASLLLRVVSSEGSGALTGVTDVARTDTQGGLPPTSGCDAAHANATVGVRYTAVYAFYR